MMIKKILFAFFGTICITNMAHAVQWWQQPTVCKISPTDCYASMGVGYDREMWDATGNCWGLKLICPDATEAQDRDAVPMGRAEIASGSGINPDFDTNILNGDCYGARKTKDNGSMVSVNSQYVNVYCAGVLSNPDETVATGEIITTGRQPTCQQLANDGYVAVLNGKCYGKYYDTDKYYIECGAAQIPNRLIILNGADYTPGGNNTDERAAANKVFDTIYNNARAQHIIHYGK